MINMIIQVLAAGFASLGFAILYNVKGHKIWVSFFGGIFNLGTIFDTIQNISSRCYLLFLSNIIYNFLCRISCTNF